MTPTGIRNLTKIVLIDDDESMAAMMSEYLRGEGFMVSHAKTAAVGLRMAGEHGVALVLLDVMLPDLDGFSLLSRLRETSQVPVIMLTMQGAVLERVRGLELGADDYVPKPFTPIEVVARIRSLLRRTPFMAPRQPRLEIDDVVLEAASCTILQEGRIVPCTAAEFEALYVLAVCAGNVISKEDLTRTALGRTSYVGDRGVDNLVHSLRKKLGSRADGEDRFKAIRNIGYMYLRPIQSDGAGAGE